MFSRFVVVMTVVFVLFAAGVYVLVARYRTGNPSTQVTAIPAAGTAGFAATETALGTIVTQDGFTLYRFDKDVAKPSKSTCVTTCATTWPPVVVTGRAPAIEGVDPAVVATVKRTDGKVQLTIGGWPVYRYSGDKAAGDTLGQGVGGTWFAVGVTGAKVG
jgi:predicted lipoprotein with Yx(FWY)xxD motif